MKEWNTNDGLKLTVDKHRITLECNNFQNLEDKYDDTFILGKAYRLILDAIASDVACRCSDERSKAEDTFEMKGIWEWWYEYMFPEFAPSND